MTSVCISAAKIDNGLKIFGLKMGLKLTRMRSVKINQIHIVLKFISIFITLVDNIVNDAR